MTKLITYGELELSVKAGWINTSFDHSFGTHKQGHYEITEIKHNNTIIPLALISENTLDWIENEVNK